MSFSTELQQHFNQLATAIFAELQSDEALALTLKAEQQTYIRFNNAKIRQATTVWQRHLNLQLQHNGRTIDYSFDLSHDLTANRQTALSLLQHARQELLVLPLDPYQVTMQNHGASHTDAHGQLPNNDELLACITEHTENTGFTGLFAAGPQIRAVQNSAGLNHWFSTASFFLDYSLYTSNVDGEAKAVKNLYADRIWQPEQFSQTLQANKQHLALLQAPSKALPPGHYRVYLAPAAVAELISMFSWGAVSFNAYKNGECALHDLVNGQASLSAQFNLLENFDLALAPHFNSLGELPPTQLSIIEQGKLKNLLISSRSAKEYNVTANAADPSGWAGEYLRSAELLPGDLPEKLALTALDTGIYISNLHYLNWSDLQTARITGMTRYACFWVEQGKIIAPIKDLRFDDSLYRLFGSELLALTQESYVMPSVDTYEIRNLGGCKIPGALINSMHFTL